MNRIKTPFIHSKMKRWEEWANLLACGAFLYDQRTPNLVSATFGSHWDQKGLHDGRLLQIIADLARIIPKKPWDDEERALLLIKSPRQERDNTLAIEKYWRNIRCKLYCDVWLAPLIVNVPRLLADKLLADEQSGDIWYWSQLTEQEKIEQRRSPALITYLISLMIGAYDQARHFLRPFSCKEIIRKLKLMFFHTPPDYLRNALEGFDPQLQQALIKHFTSLYQLYLILRDWGRSSRCFDVFWTYRPHPEDEAYWATVIVKLGFMYSGRRIDPEDHPSGTVMGYLASRYLRPKSFRGDLYPFFQHPPISQSNLFHQPTVDYFLGHVAHPSWKLSNPVHVALEQIRWHRICGPGMEQLNTRFH